MCRSDAQVLGPHSQYLPKIVSIFAEVILTSVLALSV